MNSEPSAFLTGVVMTSAIWLFAVVNYTTNNKTLVEKGCMEYNKTTGELQFKEKR